MQFYRSTARLARKWDTALFHDDGEDRAARPAQDRYWKAS